jgi:hypothetical protein
VQQRKKKWRAKAARDMNDKLSKVSGAQLIIGA